MNLKPKRLVRTAYSEQYALFDLDRTDDNYDPLSVGKLDLHYTQHGVYGTLLFWQEASEERSWDDILEEAELLVAEFQAPMGVSGEYALELFSPTLQRYEVLSNIDTEESGYPHSFDSDELTDGEIESENGGYRSIWPAPEQDFLEEEMEPENDISDEADDEEEDAYDPGPTRRPGIHGQPEWLDD
jgi:hypothetical protein